MNVQAQSGPWQMRSRPSGAGKTSPTVRQAMIAAIRSRSSSSAATPEREPAAVEVKLLCRRAREPVRAQEIERLVRRAAAGRERRHDHEQGFSQPLGALECASRTSRIRLCVAGEGAQALARQQVRVRGPVEQALVAVEPVARRGFIAPRHGVDEIERRFAADEVFRAEAMILDNL